ncbi:hypothetical protein D3C79_793570 [compost metagenome]
MKRLLMVEQQVLVTDRNHIVMEHALVDHRRVLLYEYRMLLIQLMKTSNCLACFTRLACRITRRGRFTAKLLATINKHLHTTFTVVAAQSVVVGRPFVAKQRHLRQGFVMGKMAWIVKNRP